MQHVAVVNLSAGKWCMEIPGHLKPGTDRQLADRYRVKAITFFRNSLIEVNVHTHYLSNASEKEQSKSCIFVHSKKFHPKSSRIPRTTVQLQRLYHKYTASPAFSESIIFTEYMVRSQSLCLVGLDSNTRHREILDKCKNSHTACRNNLQQEKRMYSRHPGYMIASWT